MNEGLLGADLDPQGAARDNRHLRPCRPRVLADVADEVARLLAEERRLRRAHA